DWWAGYGFEVPTMQRAAIRILSQPCSSYWCRWNWSTFENIHTKKLNRVEHEKFNDLVFVHCNLRLQILMHASQFDPLRPLRSQIPLRIPPFVTNSLKDRLSS
ncbi:hypothetical protein FRX31_005083, partial [Thalictrum thalictroides]